MNGKSAGIILLNHKFKPVSENTRHFAGYNRMMAVKAINKRANRNVVGFFFKIVALFLFYVIIIIMRIDKLLCEMNIGTRTEVKNLLKKGLIFVDGKKITKPDTKVDEFTTVISYKGKEYRYTSFVYYMLNKPSGVISATSDNKDITVIDLLKKHLTASGADGLIGIPFQNIFPVGRLDKDTVGLLLLTNNGELAHNLLSPKKHVPKKYYVILNSSLNAEQISSLEKGVVIGENEITKEAVVNQVTENSCYITISEGKFHQIKRMFQAVGLQVTYLKRISMGNLILDETLKEGEIRPLTEEEVNNLC